MKTDFITGFMIGVSDAFFRARKSYVTDVDYVHLPKRNSVTARHDARSHGIERRSAFPRKLGVVLDVILQFD